MGWLDGFHGKTVAIDTAPLIYYIEDHPQYATQLQPLFEAVENGQIRLVTSVMTLVEVLVHPIRRGDERLAHEYFDFLMSSEHVHTLPVTAGIARLAAELRAGGTLKTPDAIQLAVAIEAGAEVLVTNDRDFGSDHQLQVIRVSEIVS